LYGVIAVVVAHLFARDLLARRPATDDLTAWFVCWPIGLTWPLVGVGMVIIFLLRRVD
jgi:hypothetical protein